MFFISETISLTTALLLLLIKKNAFLALLYSVCFPFVLFLPRLLMYIGALRRRVYLSWVYFFEKANAVLLLVTIPGTFFLHERGIQYDRFEHFIAGFFIYFIGVLLCIVLWAPKKQGSRQSAIFFLMIVFCIVFVSLFAWEGIQYLSDRYLGSHSFFDVAQDIHVDFWEDIFFGFSGAVLALFIVNRFFSHFLSLLKRN